MITSNHKHLLAGVLLGLALAWIYHRRMGGTGGAGE